MLELTKIEQNILSRRLIQLGNDFNLSATEELSELIQALSKINRCDNQVNYDNLVEEITDVLIMINMAMEKYNIKIEDINTWKSSKINKIYGYVLRGLK